MITQPVNADRFRNFLAFALIGAFVSMLPVLIIWAIPIPNKDIITYMIGQLSGMASTCVAFYFVNKAGQEALDSKRVENTGKLADAVVAAANATPSKDTAVAAANAVANAASDKADQIKGADV